MPENLRHVRRNCLVGLALALSACANHQPENPTPSVQKAELAKQTTPPVPEPVVEKVPSRPFEAETLYALLVAEIAGSRNRYDIAVGNYVQQALATRDPGVTARAARIARLLNAHKAALEMANLWIELEPNNPEAHFIAGAELARLGRLVEATEHSAVLLRQGEETFFEAIAASAAQTDDQLMVKRLQLRYAQLIEQYPDDSNLYLGQSILWQSEGKLEKALSATRQATRLDPSNYQAFLQETQLLEQMGRPDEARQNLAQLVERFPDNQRLRLHYARLVTSDDLAEAQRQFQTLVEQSPGDADFTFSLALIQFERGMLVEAAHHFENLVSGGEHSDPAHYYLGRIAEARGDPSAALSHYRQVSPGDDYLPAVMKAAEMLVQLGDAQGALQYLQSEREKFPEQRESLYLIEAEVLDDIHGEAAALAILKRGLAEFPQSTKLLYARSMLFADMNDIAKAEQDLKHIIDLAPNNAAALNALGYTLADHTSRLNEAYGYIRAALDLAPNDASVLDSMGWVNYRLGNYNEALDYLQRAMQAMPDHEIAAHLGEVLWVTGEQDKARKIWRTGLEINPSSGIIRETLERFDAELEQ